MSNFAICSDSGGDLSPKICKEYDIYIIPLLVSIDDGDYLREGVDITIEQFYKKIKEKVVGVKTSLPAIQSYITHFEKHLKAGKDIICITLASEVSGSYQSAINAAKMILKDYKDRKIEIVDSKKVSIAQGILAMQASKMRDKDYTLEKTVEIINKTKLDGLVLFTVDNLNYLVKGGRVNKLMSIASNIFDIKPIIKLNTKLEPIAKVKGRKKSILEMASIFVKELGNEKDKYEIVIASTNCIEGAEFLRKVLKEKYNINVEYEAFNIGIGISAHTGPTGIGIGFIRKFDTV